MGPWMTQGAPSLVPRHFPWGFNFTVLGLEDLKEREALEPPPTTCLSGC